MDTLSAEIYEKIAELQKIFVQREWTLGLAESCTAGLISSMIGSRPGVSKFFAGSVVSYAGSVKANLLHVQRSSMQCHGEVSVPVALEMARGVRKLLKTDWAVSVTGIAGPTGGSDEKPVGTVCFAVVGPGFERAETRYFKLADRQKIQLASAQFAIQSLWDSIHA
jgi:PncC family amidohydrolase